MASTVQQVAGAVDQYLRQGGRSVDASRDKGVVRKTDARSEGMKKGCEEQWEGPGRRKATGKTCADRKEKRKLGRKTNR